MGSRRSRVWGAPNPFRDLLKQVSRSFYLTLAVLPRPLRGPVSLAYLLARAADTIADTRILPRTDRLGYLDGFRAELDLASASLRREIADALAGPRHPAAERELVLRLPEWFALYRALPEADRLRVRALLLNLTHGMQQDLRTFPGESGDTLAALESREDLERYTYYAAGCVGEFWTDMAMAHCPALRGWDAAAMRRRGVRFGQGLQLTNVLRDLAHDLRSGRCYLPRAELAPLGLSPPDLLRPTALAPLRPLLRSLLRLTLAHFAEGWAYTLAIPRGQTRLRLACAWPLLLGIRTLEQIQRARDLLDPRLTLKIPRSTVYTVLARSACLAWWDQGLTWYYDAARARVDASVAATG